MDKKNKKNGAATGGSTEDKDRTRKSDPPSSKPKPVHIAINNGDKATKVRAASSTGPGDKDTRHSSGNDDKASSAHARDETTNGTTKNGPQKKRRKVTHGTALYFQPPLPFSPLRHQQKPPPPKKKKKKKKSYGVNPKFGPASVTAHTSWTTCTAFSFRALMYFVFSRSYSLRILPQICKSLIGSAVSNHPPPFSAFPQARAMGGWAAICCAAQRWAQNVARLSISLFVSQAE